MSGDQERDAAWQHPDNRFRLRQCAECADKDRQIKEKDALLLMYREQIKGYQQREVR